MTAEFTVNDVPIESRDFRVVPDTEAGFTKIESAMQEMTLQQLIDALLALPVEARAMPVRATFDAGCGLTGIYGVKIATYEKLIDEEYVTIKCVELEGD